MDRDSEEFRSSCGQFKPSSFVVGGVQNIGQRQLDKLGHLKAIGVQLVASADQAKHGRNPKSGHREVVGKLGKNHHRLRAKPHLFGGLAQGGLMDRSVLWLGSVNGGALSSRST